MSQLLIPDIAPAVLAHLRQRASQHGHSVEDEARTVLEHSVTETASSVWESVDAIHRRLAASGRQFTDSAELLREDRDR